MIPPLPPLTPSSDTGSKSSSHAISKAIILRDEIYKSNGSNRTCQQIMVWGFFRVNLLETTFFCWELQEEVIHL